MEVLNAILTAPMRPAGELLLFRPIIVFGSSVAPSDLGPSTSCVLGATSCSNKTGERTNFLIPSGERVRILYDSEHPARVALGAAHARRNMSLASRCNDWVLLSKDKYHISIHHVCGHAGNAGNECADIATSFRTDGFISECDVPS